MREDVIRVVEIFIDAFQKNDGDALPLHPDVVFESPLNRIQGIAAFRIGLAEFLSILKSIEVVRLIADDHSCAAALKLYTTFGMIHFLELFHVVDGQIVYIRAYYDPRPILEGMHEP